MNAVRFEDGFDAEAFLLLAERVWPRGYDAVRAQGALERSVNIGAWDGPRLVGAVRLLTDGYFFSVVSEILVDPEYQRRGIGRTLMEMALARAPGRAMFLGAQPQSVGFFEKIGCEPGPKGMVMRKRDGASL
jgi:ribosomal protein S18 acetylase RimI-like enzyme